MPSTSFLSGPAVGFGVRSGLFRQWGRELFFLLFVSANVAVHAASFYPQRLADAKAVRVAGGGDDPVALRRAIDQAQSVGQGIVMVPPGRYQITDTLYVWPGVRVIGYGETRPVLVLPEHTPGFMEAARTGSSVVFSRSRARTALYSVRTRFPGR
jgi:hypothetical protein